MAGDLCNGLAPHGLRTPGQVHYLDLPWDPQTKRYECGQHVARLNGLDVLRGMSNFTVKATIIPRRDDVIAVTEYAAVLQRRNGSEETGLYIGFQDDISTETDRNGTLQRFVENSIEFIIGVNPQNYFRVRYDGLWRANIPQTFTWIHQQGDMFVYLNSTLLDVLRGLPVRDLNTPMADPLEICPVFYPNTPDRDFDDIIVPLDGFISDIRISNTVDFPTMSAQEA